MNNLQGPILVNGFERAILNKKIERPILVNNSEMLSVMNNLEG